MFVLRRMQCATRENLNFPEYMFSLSFSAPAGDNFGKQKQHKRKKQSIPRELMKLVFKTEEGISPESHYRRVSAICTGFYGNRKSLIIFKVSHI